MYVMGIQLKILQKAKYSHNFYFAVSETNPTSSGFI